LLPHFASPFKGMYPLDQTLTYLLLPYHIIRDIQMRKTIVSFLFLSTLFGCTTDNTVIDNPKNESFSSKLYKPELIGDFNYKGPHYKGPPFELDLSLVQTSPVLTTLTATLSLDSGDYVVSPYTTQDYLGVFDLVLLDSTHLEFVGNLIEFPPPIDMFFSFEDLPIISYVGSTRLSRLLRISTVGDFEAYGEIFFVHEPSCLPYIVSFVITRKQGELSVTKTGTQMPNC